MYISGEGVGGSKFDMSRLRNIYVAWPCHLAIAMSLGNSKD